MWLEIVLGVVLYLILGGVVANLWCRFTRGPLHPLGVVLWIFVLVGVLGALLVDAGAFVARKLFGR